MGIFANRNAVSNSEDFHRIVNLPRRTWSDKDLEQLARDLTALLKTPDGTWSLRPKQALALHDFGVYGGLVGLLRVGAGKELISMLLPKMVAPAPRSPVLLVPASLIEKTERARHLLSRHWKISKNLRLMSYEMLGRVQGAELLERYGTDLLILDEAHRAKNRRAGVTKRLLRYMHAHPSTKVAVMSGTLVKRGLKDAGHLIAWALKDGAPVPLKFGDLEEWADALDEQVNPLRRFRPGPLLTLNGKPPALEDEDAELAFARKAFHQRLIETPGVVTTGGEQVDASLNITAVHYPEDSITNGHFETLRGKWETPDGWALTEAVSVWRHARELALGLHYSWNPRPPEEWLNARRAWASFVRKILAHSRHLDTELQVKLAVKSGTLESAELNAWESIAPSFTPNPVPNWHDRSALDAAQAWMHRHVGIVWCEHTFFAEELSKRTGVPYFGAQGKTSQGLSIVDFAESKDAGKVSLIASIAANSTGRNLQAWSENLLTTGITQAADLEQLLGRTHRDGQKADEVNVHMLFGCFEHWDAWQRARAQAAATLDTYGADQKLLIATCDFPGEFEMAQRKGARWQKNVAVKAPDMWTVKSLCL